MSCSPFDLRDYFLKELTDPQQRQVESHVKSCQPCREEMERLRLTEAALFSLREEEIPQRIAFVSDKIFEPSPWRRAWESFWGSTARLGFASAAMLSVALTVFALARPTPVTQVVSAPPTAPAAVQTVSDADIQARIDSAVAKALEAAETRQAERITQLASEVQQTRLRLQWAADEFERAEKRNRVLTMASGGYGPPAERGEFK